MEQNVTSLNMLFVEDDRYFRTEIAGRLRKYGQVDQADCLDSALSFLKEKKYDVAFIDLELCGKNDGLKIIEETSKRKIYPIVLTGNRDPLMIAQAYKLNCKHYFSKAEFQDNVDYHIGSYLNSLKSNEIDLFFQKNYITNDETLKNSIKLLAHQNLSRDQKILITGPTGVGKSELAKFIHYLAEGTKERFVHTNLAEQQESLVEAHLFGRKKGAYTGADSDQDGLFKTADGGSLFLDEIGVIPVYLQKKLLKVLQEKEFTPLGSQKLIKSDFRLISATCDDLGELIQEKKFRADLYFRLKGIEIEIPALKDRRFDIPLLINHFISKSARKIHIADDTMNFLTHYDWFGNVRELEDLVRKYTKSNLGVIEKKHLPEYILKNKNPFSSSDKDSKIYSKNIANYIMRHGIRGLVELIENEAFKDFWSKTEGKITKTQSCLGIGKSATYAIKDRLEKQGGLNLGQ